MELRPYQHEGLDKARADFRDGLKRLLIYSPTGSGKTEIGMQMIKKAREKNTRVIFVANRIGLVEQTSRRFYQSGIEHGVVQGNNTRKTDAGVLVCSIQTLAKRGFPDAGMIVIDEAHGCAANKAYRELIMKYPGVPVIGLSATPFARGLGKVYPGLGPLFQKIVKVVTIQELIQLGFLVDVDIWAPSEPDLSNVKIVAGDYDEKELAAAVDKDVLIGDIVKHWLLLGNNKQTVCFATNIPHSKHICDQFNAAGISAEHLDCYTPDEERRGILQRIDNGTTRIVTNCAVLAEGWDCPAVEVMICARPTRSLTRWIQMAGRILRIFKGKDRATILDHSGTATRLGFPTDDLHLELDDGKPRKAANPKEKEEKLPKLCPSCKHLKPAGIHQCPKCGFAPQKQSAVQHEEGSLEQLRRKKKKEYTTVEREQVYAELLGYAKEKKYQPGWAYFSAKEFFGVAPATRNGISALPPGEDTLRLIKEMQIRKAKARESEARKLAA